MEDPSDGEVAAGLVPPVASFTSLSSAPHDEEDDVPWAGRRFCGSRCPGSFC